MNNIYIFEFHWSVPYEADGTEICPISFDGTREEVVKDFTEFLIKNKSKNYVTYRNCPWGFNPRDYLWKYDGKMGLICVSIYSLEEWLKKNKAIL